MPTRELTAKQAELARAMTEVVDQMWLAYLEARDNGLTQAVHTGLRGTLYGAHQPQELLRLLAQLMARQETMPATDTLLHVIYLRLEPVGKRLGVADMVYHEYVVDYMAALGNLEMPTPGWFGSVCYIGFMLEYLCAHEDGKIFRIDSAIAEHFMAAAKDADLPHVMRLLGTYVRGVTHHRTVPMHQNLGE